MSGEDHDGVAFDLIAIVANSWWAPLPEISAEVCLREAAAGRRVGFVFLDIVNPDEVPLPAASARLGAWAYRAERCRRIPRIRKIEQILRDHGVTVFPAVSSQARLTCQQAGIDSIASLKEFRLGEARLGIGTLSSLITRLVDSEPDFADSRPLIDSFLTCAYQAFELTRDVIGRYRPARVLLLNGRFAYPNAVAEAARLAGVERWYCNELRSPQRFYLSAEPFYNAIASHAALRSDWESADGNREAIATAFFSPRRGGMELIDSGFREKQISGNCPPASGRRRIVYFASSIDERASVETGFDGALFESQHAAVAWLAAWARERPDVELFIRVHPRMADRFSVRERRWWNSVGGGNVMTLAAESPVDSYALALSADRVVTYHSTMGAEATYLGKVSILVGGADYRGLDCVYEPSSVQELETMLTDDALAPKARENCLPFGYQRLMHGEPFRFYQPRSLVEGSFFGVETTPFWSDLPFRNRVAITAARKLNSLVWRAKTASGMWVK